MGRNRNVGIICSGDPSPDRKCLHIFAYVCQPHRPFFVLCDVSGMA